MSTIPPVSSIQPSGDADWHARLLASLHDCGVQRAPRNRLRQWVITFSVVVAFTIFSKALDAFLTENLHTEGDQMVGMAIRIAWFVFYVLVCARFYNGALRSAWQTSARSAEEELNRSGSRRPILYLRSFQLDEKIGRPLWTERWLGLIPMETAEQAVMKLLRKQGPTIAIGRPDEQLPSLGAARFYVSHDRWQQKVSDVAKESKYVLFATGVTEGLRWEVSHLVASVPPEKIILWAHPHLLRVGPREREAEWTKFRTMLGDAFPKPLPETLGEARFIYFSADWTPHAVAPRRRLLPYANANRSALRVLLRAKNGALPEAKAIYTGPREGDDFARLIGAEGRPVNWLRAGGFAAAYLLATLVFLCLTKTDETTFGDWIYTLGGSLLFAALTITAFRLIQSRIWAVIATALVYTLLIWLCDLARYQEGEYASGLEMLAHVIWSPRNIAPLPYALLFLAGIVWSTRRMAPLWWALLFGALWPPVCFLLFQMLHERDFNLEETPLQYRASVAVVFAACFAIVVRFTRPGKPTPSPVR